MTGTVVGYASEMSSSSHDIFVASTNSTVNEEGDNWYTMSCSLLEEEGTSSVSRPVIDTIAAMAKGEDD